MRNGGIGEWRYEEWRYEELRCGGWRYGGMGGDIYDMGPKKKACAIKATLTL